MIKLSKKKVVNIAKVVGQGYGKVWKDKTHRYCIIKGSRASKKSYTVALWIIYNMMKYSLANTLVIRKTYVSLKDSCWATLKQATEMLGVSAYWKFTQSPLKATYIPSGNTILFRGLDTPYSTTSINVEKGVLCWAWFEEFYEIDKEQDFNVIDLSIRSNLPEGYFFKIWMTMNPWLDTHWCKKRFFDNPDQYTLAVTTTYKCNEFLSPEIKEMMDSLYITNPKRARVECDAEWGVLNDGQVFTNWKVEDFDLSELPNKDKLIDCVGLDYGWVDEQALIQVAVDKENHKIYVYDEEYHQYQTIEQLLSMIKDKELNKKTITADNARPETTQYLNNHGCKVRPCIKGKGSVLLGIQFISDYEIIIHPTCVNFQREITLYRWQEDKFGNRLPEPIDAENHLIDSLRYALNKFYLPDHKIKRKIRRTDLGI